MRYLLPGLWHFAAALAFAASFGVFQRNDIAFWLEQPIFTVALIVCSSALFFVPDRWAKKGILKFLHYPLPDWDVLFLGPASHRNWFTHSPFLPILCLGALWKWPFSANTYGVLAGAMGVCIGVGSHLFWDCVGSERHKIIVVPHWIHLREVASRLYLLLGAFISLAVAGAIAAAFAAKPT